MWRIWDEHSAGKKGEKSKKFEGQRVSSKNIFEKRETEKKPTNIWEPFAPLATAEDIHLFRTLFVADQFKLNGVNS